MKVNRQVIDARMDFIGTVRDGVQFGTFRPSASLLRWASENRDRMTLSTSAQPTEVTYADGMPQVALRGRPPASSRSAVAEVAIELFFDHGYSGTTVAMIAEGAGISKTSFFRYFSSKAEIVWADFDAHTDRLRARLAEGGSSGLAAVRRAVVDNLRADLDSGGVSLRRFELLDTSSELRSEESVRWFAWAEIVTEHLQLSSGREYPTPPQAAVGSAIQATMLAVLRDGVRNPVDPEVLLARLDAELLRLCTAVEPLLVG